MFSRNEIAETLTYLVACTVFLLVGIAKQKRAVMLEQKNLEIEQANARLREMSVHLMRAQDDERRKIARELHDSVGQYLGAINMVLEPLAERVRDLSADVFAGLGQAIAITRTCATEVRKTARVALGADAHQVWLEVRDHGKGMARKNGYVGSGVGTRGMQARIKELSGELHISSDDSGTLVKTVVPLGARRPTTSQAE